MTDRKIDEPHPALVAMANIFQRCRHFLEGKDALLKHDLALWYQGGANGLTSHRHDPTGGPYIPQISADQTYDEYYNYLVRATYYNVVGRSRDGFVGLIMGKGAEIEGVDDAMDNDCDLEGTPLEEKIEEAVTEVLNVGRFGWLVDRPGPDAVMGLSKLDEDRSKIRPYLVAYKAEDIVWWHRARFGNVTVLDCVVLRECVEHEKNPRYRELYMGIEEGVFAYRVRLWTKAEDAQEYTAEALPMPLMNNAPIRELPFYFFDPKGGRCDPAKPPLLDLVELARSHWQTSADLEHAAFTTALPTPVLAGFPTTGPAGQVLTPVFGGLNYLQSDMAEAKAYFLEYSGAGLTALEARLASKETQIAHLGGRMLADEKKTAETATTTRIRSSGESATLADIARSVARIASQALTFANAWAGRAGEAVVTLATDYTQAQVEATIVSALDKSVTAGHLAQTDYNGYLRATGVLAPERDDEAIAADLEAEAEARAAKAADAAAAALATTAGMVAKKGKQMDGGNAA